MEKLQDSLVIVSDIHLAEESDNRSRLLLDLIKRIDTDQVKYFVLLGDIFDFCFGASRFFKNKFRGIGDALSNLARAGVKVLYLQGNHEFSIQELGWEGVEFVTKKDYILSLNEGTTIGFSHGDRIGSPWHYKIYLAITRSYWFRCAGLLCPQSFLDKLCLAISKRSRLNSSGKKIPHQKILSHMELWLDQINAEHGVVGHFHVPYQSNHPSKGKILGLCSWDQPNVLAFDGQSFCRYYIKDIGKAFIKRQVRPNIKS